MTTKPFIKTAVIGHPISHSKSPLIHNEWLKIYGLNGRYEALDIPPEDLTARLPGLFKEEGYKGVNLTIPHKEIALDICDQLDPLARTIGAVNTVTYEGGQIIGTNSDAFGFITNIKQSQPAFDFTKGPALMIGAGGAAKAILHGLLQEGTPHIYIINRTRAKAEALIGAHKNITALDWEDRNNLPEIQALNLLVNTSALGMKGQPPLTINIAALPPQALVTDIVYAPLMTDLLSQAKQQGNPVVTGIGMLLHQARPGFKLWNGIMPDVTPALEEKVLNA